MSFKDFLEESVPFKVGKEYKIFDTEDPTYEPNIAYGKYKGTGKGRLSPNKGKDVYIFTATKNKDAYINGIINVGFAFVEDGTITVEEK